MSFARLVSFAMLGTDSGTRPPSERTPDEPGGLASRIPAESPEAALLNEAAVRWTWERSGRNPDREARFGIESAPEGDLPEAGGLAGSLLGRMLRGEQEGLLAEWLERARSAGVRIPSEHLPAVLERAVGQRGLRGPIGAVCGGRGRWLVGRNPAWSAVLEPDSEPGDWETGDLARRIVALRNRRRADPEAARAALEAAWPKEPSDDRAALLEELVAEPVASDAPFLESLLRERRKEVRRLAERGLARLPDSAYAMRMAERARRCLVIADGRTEAVPPEACDPGMVRDGIEARPPAATGERAWWLVQLLAATPLGTWERESGKEPEALVGGVAGDWREAVLEGWTQAAVRQGNPAWSDALLAARSAELEWAVLRSLAACVPGPRREAAILRLLGARNRSGWDLAEESAAPWSAGFSRRILQGLRQAAAGMEGDWELRNRFGRYGALLHPDTFAEVPAGWPESAHSGGFWASGLDALTSVVAFRQELRHAFPESPSQPSYKHPERNLEAPEAEEDQARRVEGGSGIPEEAIPPAESPGPQGRFRDADPPALPTGPATPVQARAPDSIPTSSPPRTPCLRVQPPRDGCESLSEPPTEPRP